MKPRISPSYSELVLSPLVREPHTTEDMDDLADAIEKVLDQGIGVVFITHNVRHAMAVGDRFTVLNRGRTLGTAPRGEITANELQDLMAGGQELATLQGSLGGTV